MKLAALCSKAVDYPKNGKKVDLHNNLPNSLTNLKPDWHKAEVTGARDLDYYVSDRVLGDLFRAIDLYDPNEPLKGFLATPPREIVPLEDPISRAIAPLIQHLVGPGAASPGPVNAQAHGLHARYTREMQFICMTHTLIDAPDVRLTEEEVVLGTILANCTQPHARSNRAYRLKFHTDTLVRDIRSRIMPSEDRAVTVGPQLLDGLRNGWAVWGWAQHHLDEEFIESFSLIALGVILDCLKKLGALPDI
jgi:RNA-dependent RNA polymerase